MTNIIVVIIIIIIIIIIVVVVGAAAAAVAVVVDDDDLIPRLIICMLGNLHLPELVSGIRHICNSTAFCLILRMFLVKPIFFRYLRKFVVTTPSIEITKVHIVMLLSFQALLISRAKFSYFIIFSVSFLGKLRVKGTALCIASAVLFSLSMSTMAAVLKSIFLLVMIDLSQYKLLLADASTSSGLYV